MKASLAHLRVGDTVPFSDIDRDALRDSRRRRGQLANAAKSTRQTENIHRARLILAGLADNERRANCPVEQARGTLIKRGHYVNRASVWGGPNGLWIVDGRKDRPLSDAGLIAKAKGSRTLAGVVGELV